MRMKRCVGVVVCFEILILQFLLVAQTSPEGPIALVGGTLLDGTGSEPFQNVVVVLDGGRVSAVGRVGQVSIPESARRIDTRNNYILPGLLDGHVHLQSLGAAAFGGYEVFGDELVERIAKHARSHLLSGVTTVFDVGGPLHELKQVRDQIESGERAGSRIFIAGPITTADRDYPLPAPRSAAEALHQRNLVRGEFKGVAGARAKVRELVRLGVDHIKVYQTGGFDHGYAGYAARVPPEEMKVVVEEAHAAGIPVTAHTRGIEGFRNGIAAGLDSMQHVVYCGISMPDEVIDLLARSPVYIIPTMVAISQFWDGVQEDSSFLEVDRIALDLPRKAVDELFELMADPIKNTRHEYYNMSFAEIPKGRRNLRRLIAAGAPIAMGTDAGTVANFHGTSYREVAELVRAGMSPMQAIVAGTRNTAAAFQKEDLGVIQVGKVADVIVVDRNPLEDIRNLSRIVHVFKSGRQYK